MQLYPQRARAGPPLQLVVRGDGCAGGSGVLSITQLGAARDTGNIDRLVVRRRIDVAADGSWSTHPLLVGQPPGSYRVDASCERRAVTDQIGTDVDRRDLFTASEVLELTAPAATDNFDVTPPFAPPGTPLTVLISGVAALPGEHRRRAQHGERDRHPERRRHRRHAVVQRHRRRAGQLARPGHVQRVGGPGLLQRLGHVLGRVRLRRSDDPLHGHVGDRRAAGLPLDRDPARRSRQPGDAGPRPADLHGVTRGSRRPAGGPIGSGC